MLSNNEQNYNKSAEVLTVTVPSLVNETKFGAVRVTQTITASPVVNENSFGSAVFTKLKPQHYKHLLDEGFTPQQVVSWERDGGIQSIDATEAKELGFKVWGKDGWQEAGSGLLFKFTPTFSQLRADTPPINANGKPAKYITPYRAQSEAYLPDDAEAVTEGLKDAMAGTLHGGVATGAIAGVSHYRKALPQGCKKTIIFDSDGWHNQQVVANLVRAGDWCEGKIQLIPTIEGQPKAGLCEYFKAGYTSEDYKSLLKSAFKPDDFILEVAKRMSNSTTAKEIESLLKLAVERNWDDINCTLLIRNIADFTGVDKRTLRKTLAEMQQKAALRSNQQAIGQKSAEALTLKLVIDNDATEHQSKLATQTRLQRRAEALLHSGKLFNVMQKMLQNVGAVGIGDHVTLGVASVISTLRGDKARNMPVLFTGSSGIGKSMALDAIESFLPNNFSIRKSGVTEAVLKRYGDKLSKSVLLIDELSTWAGSEQVLSILKELITSGSCNFDMAVPGSKPGEWDIETFIVEGPVCVAACTTEQTLATMLKHQEEEVRSRFNELPLPEDAEYISQIAWAAFNGVAPKKLEVRYPRLINVVRLAIELAISKPIPTLDPALGTAMEPIIKAKADRALFPRLMKRLRILLENTAALLGQEQIDIETYAVVYPLISKVFRRSLTSENDATLDNFSRVANKSKDAVTGNFFAFKVAHIQEALSASKTSAYRWKDKWEAQGWIDEGQRHGTLIITPKGAKVLSEVSTGKQGLPDILPPVEMLRKEIEKFPPLNPIQGKEYSEKLPTNSHEFPPFSHPPITPITYIDKEIERVGEEKNPSFSHPTEEVRRKNICEADIPNDLLAEFRKAVKSVREKEANIFSVDTSGKVGKTIPEMHSNADGAYNRWVGKTWENGGNLREFGEKKSALDGSMKRIHEGDTVQVRSTGQRGIITKLEKSLKKRTVKTAILRLGEGDRQLFVEDTNLLHKIED